MSSSVPVWRVGVARRVINPMPGVELAGLGYYLNRTWERVRDNLNATAMVVSDAKGRSVALVVLDLMYNDAAFTAAIRQRVAEQTDLAAESICINCSHSHNAPTAGLIRGCGDRHPAYLQFAAEEAAIAVVEAWRNRRMAKLFVGQAELTGMTFNRTRENGPTDNHVSVLRADSADGRPLAIAVNFHSHCTAHMEIDLRAVGRDWPGEVVDQLESEFPGATALYLQGTCGDVNFRREFNGTEKRFEPARALTKTAMAALGNARELELPNVSFCSQNITLPTRRWERHEVMRDRKEGLHRLHTGDRTGWLEGVARACVNQPERLPLRYGGSVEKAIAAIARFAVEWTDDILPKLDSTPETLKAEVQAIRIGDVCFVANPAELFTTLGLEVRRQWREQDLFMLGYSNGSVGYLPDAHEIARGGYAAIQSPKFTGQFPFTPNSGLVMVQGLLSALEEVKRARG